MAYKEKAISRLQPLQIDTIELAPKSYIRGVIGDPFNVVGTALADKITLARTVGVALPSGTYNIEVVVAGVAGTGSYKIVDADNGTKTATILTSASAVLGSIAGVGVIVTDTSGTVAGDYVQFVVDGDQTRIIPGTIVTQLTDGANKGKWVPAYADITNGGAVRVVNGFAQTDKTKLQPQDSYEVNISTVNTTSVILFGVAIEAVARAINLTDALKAKITGIVWE